MPVALSDSWNLWVEPFDLFISYARKDNDGEPKMVSAFVETIEADFRRLSPDQPLKVFFDKEAIPDGAYWEREIRAGIRQSKVMLAFLSEAYFNSEWCRREWEEYLLVEQARTYPGEALTPIFVIDPAHLMKHIPPSARAWWNDLSPRNGIVEIHPHWAKGRRALQEEIVVKRLDSMVRNILARVEHGRVLALVPRDLRGRNPHFVGRRRELGRLHLALHQQCLVGICAVNGVGGIGKSALAREYAYCFRKDYLGGQFEIDLSRSRTPQAVQGEIVRLARGYLKANIPEQWPEEKQFQYARDAFQQLDPNKKALLILDNLEEADTALIAEHREHLFPSPEKVHLLVTTRAEPRDLGEMHALSLDVLPPDEALDVLFRYRAFARRPDDPDYLLAREGKYPLGEFDDVPPDEEWKAALSIVNRLGRHTLAVSLVGAYLGLYPDIPYGEFARDMARDGIGLTLADAANESKVRGLIEHPAPLIGDLFERSLARLSPLALRTLEYAAFLPPDLVPLAWLKELVQADSDMTVYLEQKSRKTAPWAETLRTLAGLQYLVGEPQARLHRVLGEVIRGRMIETSRDGREAAVIAWVENFAGVIYDGDERYADLNDLASVDQFVRSHASRRERLLGRTAMCLVPTYQNLGRLGAARDMARIAELILKAVLADDPQSAQKKRDLSISFERLGDVSVKSGDLKAARGFFEQGLRLSEQLAQDDPHSAEKKRDLWISFNKLGNVRLDSGDLKAARGFFEQGLRLSEQLAQDDPHSAQKKRDLSISFSKLGEVSVKSGDLKAARGFFEQGLRIREKLAQDDPHSAERKRDLSISFNKLGDVSLDSGDLKAARGFFEQGLRLSEQLAQDDPHSAEKKRDLSISFFKLGEVSVKSGDLKAARGFFEQGLRISEQLAQDDPQSAQKKGDLSFSFFKLGEVSAKSGDLKAARGFFEQSLRIREQLAQDDPLSAERKRDLSISFNKLGDVSLDSGDLKAARGFFEQSLRISEQLAQDDPHSAEKKRDLSISFNKLGDVSVDSGDLKAARGFFEQGLRISEQLAQDDPHSAEKKRDLSFFFNNLGNVRLDSGDLKAARGFFEQGLSISEQLAQDDPLSAEKKRDLGVSYFNLFDLEKKADDRSAARERLSGFIEVFGELEAEGHLPSPQDQRHLQHYRQELENWSGE